MALSRFMRGSPLLVGDNSIPGLRLPEELKPLVPKIIQACRDFGLNFYDIVIQMLTYDEISEVAAYGGFPVRYPHWQWGMEYNELQRGYEHGMHRIYEMVVNCLHPKTMVLTSKGTVPAERVMVGDTVFAGPNKFRTVVAVERQTASPTVKVKVKGFADEIICTPKHKWRVLSENGFEWKEASLLQSKDILVGGDSYLDFRCHPAEIGWNADKIMTETTANHRSILKQIQVSSQMTLELAELIGVITGDGSQGVKGRENMVSVTVDKRLPDYIDHVSNLFINAIGIEPLVETHRKSVDVVTVCSKVAVDFLDYLGIQKGCTFVEKRIPWSIWESSNEYRCAFLRGLFDTDGCSSGCVSFSCYNFDLAKDVQLMLLEMGIKTHYFLTENGKNLIHVLRVVGKRSIEKFYERIGFTIDYKNDWLDELINAGTSSNRGVKLPYVQKLVLDLGKSMGINTYNNPSLGRSLKVMQRKTVGSNVLSGFMTRFREWYGVVEREKVREILDLLDLPFYEVQEVQNGEVYNTIDIALSHDDHDFIAGGFVSHNTNPCYIYCLDSNTLVDNVTVIAHAIGHNDFFKNNVYFSPTSQNMMNELANHGTRIRKYMQRWGKERVTEFIDHVLRIETLIDPAKAFEKKVHKDPVIKDNRAYHHPVHFDVKDGHDYMDSYVNPPEWLEKQRKKIERKEAAELLELFKEPTKDVLGFIRDYAPLKPWQADIVAIIHEEAMYFSPQRLTKMLNEGWASFVDFKIMAEKGFSALGQAGEDMGIVEYAKHKMGVLGGKYSMNPYKLGFCLFQDIEERWNKGCFGTEYEECKNIREKEEWDKKLGLGHDKVLDVRKYYNDFTALAEFFTPEFCNKYEFFEWKRYPNGEYILEDRDPKRIRKKLMMKYLNGGLPDIRLVDPNFLGNRTLLLQHVWDGRLLYGPHTRATLESLRILWGNPVVLATKNTDGEEIVFYARQPWDVEIMTRTAFEENKRAANYVKIKPKSGKLSF